MPTTIDPTTALNICKTSSEGFQWLDVRSQGEFEKGSLLRSVNLPILNDEHRHQVGLCYKNEGQEMAIKLGHKLVDPIKNTMLDNWTSVLAEQKSPIVFCWRGGLRSQLTQQWLKAVNKDVLLVEGGYKALRNTLLAQLEKIPPTLVLSGRTGTHKTVLLNELGPSHMIDLEGIARHRGSAFGLELGATQPPQATFENHLLLELLNRTDETVFEDESQLIGNRRLPKELYMKMSEAPRVVIHTSREERCKNIVTDYIQHPLTESPKNKMQLQDYFNTALFRIKDRLGGDFYKDIIEKMNAAFSAETFNLSLHTLWVSSLLENYYDRAYDHSFKRKERNILFEGSFDECKFWLQNRRAEKES